MEGDSGKCADAVDQLLQLSDEMRGNHFRPGTFNLHDEMLLETYLYHGGLCQTWILVLESLNVLRSMEWTDSQPRKLWPSPLSFKKPAF